MAIKVMGDYPKISRFESGLFSLDSALRSTSGELGLPLRSIYEIYGFPGVGKSSLSYYLAGKTASVIKSDSRIELCDLEILDPDYVLASLEHAGFEGTINFMGRRDAKGKKRSHEEMVQELASNLELDAVSVAVLDSIGAIVPIAEVEGEIGEANMGKRAKLVAQMTRRAILNLRDLLIPKNMYIVNHVASIIGGRGFTTPGGEAPKFLGAIRLMISQDEVITNSKDEMIAFVSKGRVDKLRYGSRGRLFKFVVIPGYGVSKELTALIDCVDLGLATRKSVVKIGETSMGHLSKLVESAQTGYSKTFQPFFDALDEYKASVHNQVSPEETESYVESESIDVQETGED
jgi:recombination protein RecA